MPIATTQSARRAEALGARLPPLLVAAERVAATVAQGVHGRRRVGQGDSFWQFRPFLPGDSTARIDWRQSARSDRVFVRETEWEAAQTVYLWRDGGPSMHWRSKSATTDKIERADLLLLALSALLLRGGERVRLLGEEGRPVANLEALAERLPTMPPGDGMPADAKLARHARVVLVGDLLSPLERIQRSVAYMAAVPVTGHLLQILDPAEALLPYSGRVRFESTGSGKQGGMQALVPRVEGVRDAYTKRLAEQQDGIAAIASAAGWSWSTHRTDHPPEAALLALYTALAPEPGGR